jgi:hypothetical protein
MNDAIKKSHLCNKTKFATEKDALHSLKKIQKRSSRKTVPQRAYLCRCGAWHLTSKVDVFEEAKKVETLKNEIVMLKLKIKGLEQALSVMARTNTTKEGIEARKDAIVQELKRQLSDQKKINKRLRNDNKELISKIHTKNQNG